MPLWKRGRIIDKRYFEKVGRDDVARDIKKILRMSSSAILVNEVIDNDFMSSPLAQFF